MNRRIKIKVAQYKKAIKDYNLNWKQTDIILKKVCFGNLNQHTKRDIVNSKVILIGRGFASGIERQIKNSETNKTQGASLKKLTEHIYKNRSKIDRIISSIKSCKKLNEKSINKISIAHGKFCNILQKITRKSKNKHKHIPISFVSKYLHFHCNLVPLYDSFANREIKKWIDKQTLNVTKKPKEANEAYFNYLKYILQVYDELLSRIRSESTPKPNSRFVEYYALWSSNKKMP